MNQNSVLVTGASGYLGTHLCPYLLKCGRRVVCTVRRGSKLKWDGDQIVTVSAEESIEALASQFQELGVKTVVHLATYFVPEHRSLDVVPLIQANIEFGAKILEASTLAGARHFLNIGTFWQHYDGLPYSPTSLYAATKQAFSDLVQFYVDAKRLSAVTLKFPAVYGPEDPRKKIVNLLLEAVETGRILELSPGEQFLDLIHVQDAIRACEMGLLALEHLGLGNHFNFSVSSNRLITLREVVSILQKSLGKEVQVKWGAKPYRAREFFKDWKVDPSLPHWSAQISLEQGIQELVQRPKK